MQQNAFAIFFMLVLIGGLWSLWSLVAGDWARLLDAALGRAGGAGERSYQTTFAAWIEAGGRQSGGPGRLDPEEFLSRQRCFDFASDF